MNYSYSIVVRVDPRKTSSTCATCGRLTTECAGRRVWCARCRTLEDRDVNGTKNILAGGMRFVPIALPGEGMKQSKDADSMAAELTQKRWAEESTEPGDAKRYM